MGKRAFTLIELLVVISIIALLIAILLPSLTRAREAARTAVCLSNHRQIAVVMHIYVDDYESYAISLDGPLGGPYAAADPNEPGSVYATSDGGTPLAYNRSWMDLIYANCDMKGIDLFLCPSANELGLPSYGYSSSLSGWHRSSYTGTVGSNNIPIRREEVRTPSKTLQTVDYNSPYSVYANPYDYRGYYLYSTPDPGDLHQGTAVMGMVDGHAKTLQRGDERITPTLATFWTFTEYWNAFE